MEDTCRVCLCSDRLMHAITSTVFVQVWEKLTNAKFNTNDGKPLLVCYICGAQLRKSHQLMERAQKAEELLTTVINNGSKLSQKAIILVASRKPEFNYKYGIGQMLQLECKQFERNTVKIKNENAEENEEGNDINIKEEEEGNTEEDIEKENLAVSEEGNEEENYINIKEEDGDCLDSNQEDNVDVVDVESGPPPGDDALLREILEREVQIVLDRIDIGASATKLKSNEVPQKAKLDEINESKICLTNAAGKNLANVEISRRKQIINSAVNCYQVNKYSPKHMIEVKNTIQQNDKTVISHICYNNIDKESLKECLPKSTDAVDASTLLDGTDEENKSYIRYTDRPKNRFSCHMCQYKCVNKSKLNSHLRTHRGKPYTCDFCDYRSAHNSHLKRHVMYKHTKEKNFLCHICHYQSVKKHDLDIHLYTHTGEIPFTCDICDYRCTQRRYLINHIKIKHTTGKPYICDYCDNKFALKHHLRDHIMYKHTKAMSFSCHICQLKCVTNSKLKTHLRIHTGEKPYICNFCSWRCARKDRLNIHIMSKHTGEKKFSCHICQLKYVTRGTLKKHLRIHTGEKPYIYVYKHTKDKKFSCHICQFKCVTKADLNRHLRKHTGEKPYICTFCSYRCSRKDNLKDHVQNKH